MKLLLDENLPHQLRNELPGHECFTIAFMKWKGIKNGRLLSLAAGESFDALVTKDVALEHQQNLHELPVSVIIIHARSNDIEDIRPLLSRLLQVLGHLPSRQIIHVQ